MRLVLVSACLLGCRVRYNGQDAGAVPSFLEACRSQGWLLPFCPELAAGLPVPREPCEVVGGDGEAVLADRARVVSRGGLDLTQQCMAGAERAVEAARANGVTLAVLKEGSPSCGVHRIHDGTFSGRFVAGHGVTTACLRRAGIRVLSEVEEEAFWGAVQAACGEFDPPGDASDAGLR